MSTRPYDFIPCKYHHGRNVAHGPCTAKIDKEGNLCGWEPTPEERAKLLPTRKERVVKVKGEPLKNVKEEQAELAPPEGETATLEVGPASEVPSAIEYFAASDAGDNYSLPGSDSAVSDEDEKPEVSPTEDEDPTAEFETPPVIIGWCALQGVVTQFGGFEGGLCGCSELDPPNMCVTGCPDWLDRPEGAPECWGSTEAPKDVPCQQDGGECEHAETCLQATLALLAATGPTEGWCTELDQAVVMGEECGVFEGVCLNNCEHFQPLPDEGEAMGPLVEYPVYSPVPRRRYAVVDADTGEALQLSLLGAQWEDYRVKSERWSLSGGDETSQKDFEDCIVYRDRELRPGTVVEVVCRGYVKERAPIFKKDVYEGKTVIVVESLVEIELLGYRGGPIEVSLNVDGEPKVYDEPKDSESAPELETSDAVDWTGETEEAPDYEVVEDEDFFDPDGSDFGGDMFDNPGVEHEG